MVVLLLQILLGRCQCREELREERVEATSSEEPLDPYVPNPDKPCVHVTMSSAILLVNRSVSQHTDPVPYYTAPPSVRC